MFSIKVTWPIFDRLAVLLRRYLGRDGKPKGRKYTKKARIRFRFRVSGTVIFILRGEWGGYFRALKLVV
jgi:hypothetical protein